MIKLAMNQNTYNKLLNKDENTFYFIDNELKDDEIKNCNTYLLSDEIAIIRKKLLESEATEAGNEWNWETLQECRHRTYC